MSNTDLMELREHLVMMAVKAVAHSEQFDPDHQDAADFFRWIADRYDRWGRALDEVTS